MGRIWTPLSKYAARRLVNLTVCFVIALKAVPLACLDTDTILKEAAFRVFLIAYNAAKTNFNAISVPQVTIQT